MSFVFITDSIPLSVYLYFVLFFLIRHREGVEEQATADPNSSIAHFGVPSISGGSSTSMINTTLGKTSSEGLDYSVQRPTASNNVEMYPHILSRQAHIRAY